MDAMHQQEMAMNRQAPRLAERKRKEGEALDRMRRDTIKMKIRPSVCYDSKILIAGYAP
jgi:hypothetical protein